MRFLIDECLHESLVGVAQGFGFEATHVNHLGLTGKPDWELAERIVEDEFTFVTNNRLDFLQLFTRMEVHAGLVVLVPNVSPALQRALFDAVIRYLGGRELVNGVVEVSLNAQTVTVQEFRYIGEAGIEIHLQDEVGGRIDSVADPPQQDRGWPSDDSAERRRDGGIGSTSGTRPSARQL
jgi:predicted nuclease of predicted toxin-antitoxin system